MITTENLCVLFQKRREPPQIPATLQASGWGWSAPQSPRRQRPGEQQHQREQDGIAVGAIERVRLTEQLRRVANQCSGSRDEEAAKNVEAHQSLHAENKDRQQNQTPQKLLAKIGRATPAPARHGQGPGYQDGDAKQRRAYVRGDKGCYSYNEAGHEQPVDEGPAQD